jgi:hypothetical protein
MLLNWLQESSFSPSNLNWIVAATVPAIAWATVGSVAFV